MKSTYQSRFIKLKKYEETLRQSMESFNKLCQQSNFSFLYNKPSSYQFKHWQLKKKDSYILSMIKKPNISHDSTVSIHSKKIFQLNSQNLCKEIKNKQNEKSFLTSRSHSQPRERRVLSSDIPLVVKSQRFIKEKRPKTVSPARRWQGGLIEPKNSGDIKIIVQKHSRNKPGQNKSSDYDLTPWENVS